MYLAMPSDEDDEAAAMIVEEEEAEVGADLWLLFDGDEKEDDDCGVLIDEIVLLFSFFFRFRCNLFLFFDDDVAAVSFRL